MKIKKADPTDPAHIVIAQGLVGIPFELDSYEPAHQIELISEEECEQRGGGWCKDCQIRFVHGAATEVIEQVATEVLGGERTEDWTGVLNSPVPPVVTIDPAARRGGETPEFIELPEPGQLEWLGVEETTTADSAWLAAQNEDMRDPIKAFHRDNQQPSTGSLPIYTEVRNEMSNPEPTPAPRLNLIEDEDGAPLSEEQQELFGDIGDWWADVTAEDAAGCVAKAIEYGSADLDVMATGMIAIASPKWDEAPLDEQMRIGREMALGFYLMGKIGRITGALKQGRLPSDDTLKDITVYSMMLRYVRTHGSWA